MVNEARYLAWNNCCQTVTQQLEKRFLQCHFTPFFQSEPEVIPCFELNYKLLEWHKKPLSFATTRNQKKS